MIEKINISVVIIAKNEEKRIGRCLESARRADEVIVVDGLSTDKTIDIAKSFGAKVVEHEFSGSFADDRNIGMDNAKHEWVLQLDADDVVTEDFWIGLKGVLRKMEDCAAYKFRRVNFFLGHRMEHGGFHHYIPNLVNKRFVRFAGDVHEVPVHNGATGSMEGDIEHYPFDSISQFIERQNRYTDIAAHDLLKKEGALSKREIRNGMINKSFKIFWKSYIRKKGYKDGFYGLVFAILFAFINFLTWAKYLELVKVQISSYEKPETRVQKPEIGIWLLVTGYWLL